MTTTPHSPDGHNLTLPEPTPKPTSLNKQLESSVDIWISDDGLLETGVWECSPGTFTATRDGYDEVATILAGTATVTDSQGGTIDVGPGSVIVTPSGWTGTWTVHETLRKTYVIRTHRS